MRPSLSGRIRQAIVTKSPVCHRVLLYCLAFFSTFSITGSAATIVCLYVVCLLNVMVNRHYWRVPVALWRTVLLLIVCAGMAGLLSPYAHGSGVALLENWRLFLPFVLCLSIAHLKLSHWIQFFSVLLCLIALYGIIQFFNGVDWLRPPDQQLESSYAIGSKVIFRARGNFTHALTYGGYLLLLTPLIAALALCTELPGSSRKWYALVALIMLAAIVFSLSRSIWLGAAFAVCVLSFRLGRRIPLYLAVAGGIVVVLMLFSYTLTGRSAQKADSYTGMLWQRFASAFMPIHNQERLHIWQAGWDAIRDHPWWGIGARNRAEVMPRYREAITKRSGYRYITGLESNLHNNYLEIWLSGGIFALLSYLLIWVLLLKQNWTLLRKTRDWTFYPCLLLGGTAGILGFLVAGFFENNFLDGEVQVAVLLILAICLYCQTQLKQEDGITTGH